MGELFNVLTLTEVRATLARHFTMPATGEVVPILEGLGRRLIAEVYSTSDVPGFDRSTMDGYAVRAKDTFGASEGMPAYLDVAGEVSMGKQPQGHLQPGQAWRIATGGMLPAGSDAVVMVEYTEELDSSTVGVTRPVAPGENVVRRDEDLAAGEVALPAGRRLRPQDIGLLASIGVTTVEVALPLKAGIISSGDELIEPENEPAPGQIRNSNSYMVAAAVASCGGLPAMYGIVRDDYGEMRQVLARALEENDLVLLTGGSSVGTRDIAAEVIGSLGKPGVLFHGISVQPGKPTVGAAVGKKLLFGLPGHPASGMIVFELLVAPLLRTGGYPLDEDEGLPEFPLKAVVTRNLRSAAGRDDFFRVKLSGREGRLFADPVLGKSGLISTMVRANGLARIPSGKEGVEAGEIVDIKLF